MLQEVSNERPDASEFFKHQIKKKEKKEDVKSMATFPPDTTS